MDYAQKVYSKKAITLATFFGGPLVAGFLIYKNYKAFGKYDAARRSLITSIIFTIFLFYGLFLIPSSFIDKLPNSVIPFIYTGIIALFVNKYQDKLINDFLLNGGEKASNWSAAGYGLAGLILILLILIPISISMPYEGYEIKSKIYDKTLLYSSKKLDQSISDKIVIAIKQSEFLDANQESDLFLNEEGEQYILKIVLGDFKLLTDSLFLHDYNLFENVINSNSSLDKRIEVKFTNPFLNQIKDLPYIKIEDDQPDEIIPLPYEGLANLQKYQINFLQTIHFNSEMPLNDVKIVAQSITKLKGYFPPNQPLDIIFLNNGEYYTTKFFIRPEIWENFPFADKLNSTIGYFRKAGVNKEIKIILINSLDHKEKEI